MIQIDVCWSRTSASSHNHLARYPSTSKTCFLMVTPTIRTYIDKEQNRLHRFVYNARVHSVDLLEQIDSQCSQSKENCMNLFLSGVNDCVDLYLIVSNGIVICFIAKIHQKKSFDLYLFLIKLYIQFFSSFLNMSY